MSELALPSFANRAIRTLRRVAPTPEPECRRIAPSPAGHRTEQDGGRAGLFSRKHVQAARSSRVGYRNDGARLSTLVNAFCFEALFSLQFVVLFRLVLK
jgi:hypothetical protein